MVVRGIFSNENDISALWQSHIVLFAWDKGQWSFITNKPVPGYAILLKKQMNWKLQGFILHIKINSLDQEN